MATKFIKFASRTAQQVSFIFDFDSTTNILSPTNCQIKLIFYWLFFVIRVLTITLLTFRLFQDTHNKSLLEVLNFNVTFTAFETVVHCYNVVYEISCYKYRYELATLINQLSFLSGFKIGTNQQCVEEKVSIFI